MAYSEREREFAKITPHSDIHRGAAFFGLEIRARKNEQ